MAAIINHNVLIEVQRDPAQFLAKLNLKYLKQQGSIEEYINNFNSVTIDPRLSEKFKVEWFMKGLKPEISSIIEIMQPFTIHEVIYHARLQEKLLEVNINMNQDLQEVELSQKSPHNQEIHAEVGNELVDADVGYSVDSVIIQEEICLEGDGILASEDQYGLLNESVGRIHDPILSNDTNCVNMASVSPYFNEGTEEFVAYENIFLYHPNSEHSSCENTRMAENVLDKAVNDGAVSFFLLINIQLITMKLSLRKSIGTCNHMGLLKQLLKELPEGAPTCANSTNTCFQASILQPLSCIPSSSNWSRSHSHEATFVAPGQGQTPGLKQGKIQWTSEEDQRPCHAYK